MVEPKKTEVGSNDKDAAPSPEFDAFENLVKKVIKVPKAEIDRREKEYKKGKGKRGKGSQRSRD